MISPQQEEILIADIRKGDLQKFDRLYDIYAPLLMGVITNILDDETKTGHVLKETFMEVAGKLNGLDFTCDSLSSWMLRLARDQAINALPELKKRPCPDNADILELTFLCGYTLAEAAEALGMTLERARLALRIKLQQRPNQKLK